MIFAKTKMKRIPETCKKCSMARNYVGDDEKWCSVTGYCCPKEKKQSGNVGYGKPDWCPLIELEI